MTESEREKLAQSLEALAKRASIKPTVNTGVTAVSEEKPRIAELRKRKEVASYTSRTVPDGRRRRSKLVAPLNARISEEAKAMLVELSIEDSITMGQWLDNAIRAYADSRKARG